MLSNFIVMFHNQPRCIFIKYHLFSPKQEEETYEESQDMAQFDFIGEQSVSEKGRIMATSPTDMFIYGISPGFKTLH